MKLILCHTIGDGYTYSSDVVIPFEYESKEKFVFDVLEYFKDKDWKEHKTIGETFFEQVEFMGYSFDKYDIQGIEYNVFTLEEWFEKNKIQVSL
jgi:hypothetical protein